MRCSRLVISKLALMDDEPASYFSLEHLRNNLIEGNNFGLNPRSKRSALKYAVVQRPRHGNALFLTSLSVESAAGHTIGP